MIKNRQNIMGIVRVASVWELGVGWVRENGGLYKTLNLLRVRQEHPECVDTGI